MRTVLTTRGGYGSDNTGIFIGGVDLVKFGIVTGITIDVRAGCDNEITIRTQGPIVASVDTEPDGITFQHTGFDEILIEAEKTYPWWRRLMLWMEKR